MPRAGFEPPSADDTSYEAGDLPTKPPRLVNFFVTCGLLFRPLPSFNKLVGLGPLSILVLKSIRLLN